MLTRFWAKVDDRGGPAVCWPWRGTINDNGYGIVHLSTVPRITARAHRIAYELHHREPIPEDMTIDHLCRVRHCVNPAHLDVVTLGVNVLRGETTAARHARVMVCPHGHPYDELNTVWKADGSRGCRACMRLRSRTYWARNPPPPRQTACRRGHSFTPTNINHDALGRRICKVCARRRMREQYERLVSRG